MVYREDVTGYENLVKNNYDYYIKKINNRCFVFVLGNKKLLVLAESKNLKHLLGINYTTENFYFDEKPESIFNIIGKGINANGIFDFINIDRYVDRNLSKEEEAFIEKNECFVNLFGSLLSKVENKLDLYLYLKKDGDFFDSDYLYLEFVYGGEVKGYIGLKGEDKRDIFRFNSIYIDKSNRISGRKVEVSNLYIESLDYYKSVLDDDVIQSPRNINHINIKKTNREKKLKLNKTIINRINKNFVNGYLIKKGNGKASQFNLVKDKEIIIGNFQSISIWKNEEEIINYVYSKYVDSKKSQP